MIQIRDALDRMALGEVALLAGVEVERVSLFGWQIGGGVVDVDEAEAVLSDVQADLIAEAKPGEIRRGYEKLVAGAEKTVARIAELRRLHGRALRVTGQARAKRARWAGQQAWLVVSYPKLLGNPCGGEPEEDGDA